MEKLVLIDGHSIINRAFYAMPPLTDSHNRPTGGILGFLNTFFKIIDEENPTHIAVAFDMKKPTFRHEMYSDYKGTRGSMPEELKEQVPYLQEILDKMGITRVSMAGFEADDIIGTLSMRADMGGMEVRILSGDRDLLQLVTDNVLLRLPKTVKGNSTIIDYNPETIMEQYGLEPKGIVDLKALMGDASDNIPGVKGVGEKTALKLLHEYKTLDGIYEHIDDITAKALHSKLENDKDNAYLSYKLATIDVSVPIELPFDNLKMPVIQGNEQAYEVIMDYDLHSISNRFQSDSSTVEQSSKQTRSTKKKSKSLEDSFSNADEKRAEALDYFKIINSYILPFEEKEILPIEYATAIKKEIKSISDSELKLALKNSKRIAILDVLDNEVEDMDIVSKINHNNTENVLALVDNHIILLEDKKQLELAFNSDEIILFDFKKWCHRLGIYDTEYLDKHKIYDLQLMAYVVDPLMRDYSVDNILVEIGKSEEIAQLISKNNKLKTREKYKGEFYNQNNSNRVYTVEQMDYCRHRLIKEIYEGGLNYVYNDIELPLTIVLAQMEKEGILVDESELNNVSLELNQQISSLEKRIYQIAGEEFNINSPKQLGEILFDKLGLPFAKKNKNGYSTSADILEKLAPMYPIVSDILEYRHSLKLKTTYADALPNHIAEDNRVHSTFEQLTTSTGRISSLEPNLQNIPTRTEDGKKLRKAFIPKKGFKFIDGDYSQIELRILASMSEDPILIKAYKDGLDIHKITASTIFDIPLDKVDDTDRSRAKAVNFGIIYGISAFGLSQDTNISIDRAKEYIDNYFHKFPSIKAFLDALVIQAGKTGYAKTLSGRRCPISFEGNHNLVSRASRNAMNMPIQGTAADIIKIAMIKVHNRLRKKGVESKLILQIHDELLLEVKEEEADIIQEMLKEEMQTAMTIKVPLVVDIHSGYNWLEAK